MLFRSNLIFNKITISNMDDNDKIEKSEDLVENIIKASIKNLFTGSK